MNNFYCRTVQFLIKTGLHFVPMRAPELIEGDDKMQALAQKIAALNLSPVLIVSGGVIAKAGLFQPLLERLDELNISYSVFDRTVQNPTIECVEQALQMYNENGCKAIVAFGGGSPMDCAKLVAARAANPDKSISQMRGIMHVGGKLPTIFAVPTTAGSGSETTLAAVVSDGKTHEKFAVSAPCLIPHYVLLDGSLTAGLPPHITAACGMDALTHAVEAYIGRCNTADTCDDAVKAVGLIFENLETAYNDGENITARENMLYASFLAGRAFTRAFVGYVHALAHALGGRYNLSHGLCCAVLLPRVLEAYGTSVYAPVARLATAAGIGFAGDSEEIRTKLFLRRLYELQRSVGIPQALPELRREDIAELAQAALKEANPIYPVPKILQLDDLIKIYEKIL